MHYIERAVLLFKSQCHDNKAYNKATAPYQQLDFSQAAISESLSILNLEVEYGIWSHFRIYTIIGIAIHQLPQSNRIVAVVEFGDRIPPSLVQSTSILVFILREREMGDTKGPHGLLPVNGLPEPSNDFPDYPSHSIAIFGMAGRFPDADSVDELWELILEGKSMVKPAPVERLQLPQSGNHADTKWWGNFLRDPESFDHRFFKKPSREAIAWDLNRESCSKFFTRHWSQRATSARRPLLRQMIMVATLGQS